MGLTSAQDTPLGKTIAPGSISGLVDTPGTPTPSNFLDTVKKPNIGLGIKEHERVSLSPSLVLLE